MMTTRALCFGTNYRGSDYELFGCENDARDWTDALTRRGAFVTQLLGTDASKANIEEAIDEIVAKTRWGDRIVVTNSTHGTYVPNASAVGEQDRRDEAICPDDFQTAGLILDDTVAQRLGRRAWGSQAIWLADSCYSGGMAKLLEAPRWPRFSRFIPPHKAMELTRAQQRLVNASPAVSEWAKALPKLRLPGKVIWHTACAEPEVAWDAYFPDTRRFNGAFTRAAIDGLPDTATTHASWAKSIRALVGSFDQTPQLITERPYQRYYTF
jgi:hypothetical protein